MYEITHKLENVIYVALKETTLWWKQDSIGNGLKLSECLNSESWKADEELSNIAFDCALSISEILDGSNDKRWYGQSRKLIHPVYYLGNHYASVIAWFENAQDAIEYVEFRNSKLSDSDKKDGIEYSTVFEKFDEYPEENKEIE